MDTATYTRLRYPFPTLVNPLAAAIQEHTDTAWIDGETGATVPATRRSRYRKDRVQQDQPRVRGDDTC